MPIVVEVPIPARIVPPGYIVTLHVPDAGSPARETLPVATEQLGCVTVPITGAVGVGGCVVTVAETDATEVQPNELVIVNVYVPAVRFVIVVDVLVLV